jgi:hypothetical protein
MEQGIIVLSTITPRPTNDTVLPSGDRAGSLLEELRGDS